EVEEAVCVRIEEATEGVIGLDRVRTIAMEGMCTLMMEIKTGEDITKVLNEVKSKVDSISTFPAETEKPIVSSMTFSGQTIIAALSG
ncbi:MAG: hypothetical protein QGH99_08975, partial [Pseudomonadales bacterium]|nr:hypothetical protein [Pseudomonadales bacterium]